MMQAMKQMTALFMASVLCTGFALAADPAATVGENVGKEELADHAAHAGHTDAAAPATYKEEQAAQADHSGHAMHGMKDCMGTGGKKCMEMDGKKCMGMDGKKCMEMDGKHCDSHKSKKNLHKSHDACDTGKGAAQSDAKKKPAGKKSDGKDDTAKPATKLIEPVLAETEARVLAQKSNCFACHSIEKKVVGPSWKDVAAKYRGDAGAEDRLIAKISRGGSGVWGSVPMPANSPAVKDADIKALVKFILSLQ